MPGRGSGEKILDRRRHIRCSSIFRADKARIGEMANQRAFNRPIDILDSWSHREIL
jgi:hypothetical protein